jgi:hypothetical protein
VTPQRTRPVRYRIRSPSAWTEPLLHAARTQKRDPIDIAALLGGTKVSTSTNPCVRTRPPIDNPPPGARAAAGLACVGVAWKTAKHRSPPVFGHADVGSGRGARSTGRRPDAGWKRRDLVALGEAGLQPEASRCFRGQAEAERFCLRWGTRFLGAQFREYAEQLAESSERSSAVRP